MKLLTSVRTKIQLNLNLRRLQMVEPLVNVPRKARHISLLHRTLPIRILNMYIIVPQLKFSHILDPPLNLLLVLGLKGRVKLAVLGWVYREVVARLGPRLVDVDDEHVDVVEPLVVLQLLGVVEHVVVVAQGVVHELLQFLGREEALLTLEVVHDGHVIVVVDVHELFVPDNLLVPELVLVGRDLDQQC